MRKIKWLFGFRSLVPWKMFLASVYYLMGIVVLLIGWSSPALIPAGKYDLFIYKLSVLVIFLWIESPAVFLSDTSFRKKVPIFRQHTLLWSTAGMMIVCVLFTYIFASVEELHTDNYKECFNNYMSDLYVTEIYK